MDDQVSEGRGLGVRRRKQIIGIIVSVPAKENSFIVLKIPQRLRNCGRYCE